MLSLRYLLRLIAAFIGRFRGLILLGILFGVVIFVTFGVLGPKLFFADRERIGIVGRFRVETLPDNVLALIGSGLTKVNEDGTVSPALASSWESSDGGQTWTFRLREDAKWQDGKNVDSESINYQFSDAVIERPDDRTIVFKLQSPFSPFPYVVSKPTFRKGLLGTGEWRVTKARVSAGFLQKLTLVNDNGRRKEIKFYPTEDRAKLGFRLGEIDILEGVFNPKPFEEWQTAKIEQTTGTDKYVALFLNTEDKLMGEKSFRQALAYAIKKDTFDGPRAISPISPDSWAFNPQVKPYAYDPDRARKLIGDLPEEIGDLTVSIVTTPALLTVAESIAKDWNEVGIKSSVQVSSGVPVEYQALLAIFDIPDDPDQYSVWHSTQTSSNITHYKDARIDKLLEDGRVELNLEERKKIYLDFQRFLIEDSPAIFLYHPVSYTITRS
jgi:peptide/nickel transport system substrate-binding protein